MRSKAIIPGILTDNLNELQMMLDLASDFCIRVSIDVIDGLFADNLTVMPESFSELEFYNLSVDVQLMVVDPVEYLGYMHSKKVSRVFGHVERMRNTNEFIDECRELNYEPGLALDLYTPVDAIEKMHMENISGILLMSVQAGYSEQKYVDISKKIVEIRKRGFEGDIVVDGGMNEEVIPKLLKVGANQFSVTSNIWKSGDPGLRYKQLVDLLEQ
jgi:ribulose-phosphate 3-epimerase